MVDKPDSLDREASATTTSPRRRRRRWLLIVPLLLVGSLLWATNWFQQRAKLFDDAEVKFGPPRWTWLEPILQEAATEFCGVPVTLSVVDRPLSAYQVRMVGSYEPLERLALTGLTDEDMPHLSRLTNLTHLRILDSQITEAGCRHLAGMQELTSLTLESTGLSDACLQHLSKLDRLDSLDLVNGSLSEDGFQFLAQLPMLSSLTIQHCQLQGNALRPIAETSSVSCLGLLDTNVTDAMLTPFEDHGILTVLTMHRTNVSRDACQRLIEAMPYLSLGSDYDLGPRDVPFGVPGQTLYSSEVEWAVPHQTGKVNPDGQ